MTTGRILRIAAAISILIIGIIHLDLYYNAGYRGAGGPGMPNFGRSILLNAISSGVIAAAVAVRKEWFVRLAGIGLAASTIALFFYTHSGNTFLGFVHTGATFDPSPQAQIALVVELATIALLAATFIPSIQGHDVSSGVRLLGASAAVAAIVLIGVNARWSTGGSTAASSVPGASATTAPGSSAAASSVPGASTVPGAATVPGAPTVPGAATVPGPGAVAIQDFAFGPPALTVAKGTTVTWTNNDGSAHSIQGNDKSFTSKDLPKGGTFQNKFDTPGTFAYVCGIHQYMHGTITVTP